MRLFLTNYYTLLSTCKSLLTTGFTPMTWTALTPYSTNDLIKPTVANGYYYRCIQAGTSASTQPTWPTTFWAEKTDGTVKWRQEDIVHILDNEPADFSYPCVIVKDIRVMAEIQQAIGNFPLSDLRVDLSVISYMGTPIKKTWLQTRSQAFDVLNQVKQIIRNNPGLSGTSGVQRATAGVDSIDETVDNVFYKLDLIWIVSLQNRM